MAAIDAQLKQPTPDALDTPAVEAALVGGVAARERRVVDEAVCRQPLERVVHRGLVVLLGQEPPAKLLAAPRPVAEQAVGVAHDALRRRRRPDLGDVVGGELTALEEPPASHEGLADDADVVVVDVQRHSPTAGGAQSSDDGHD